MLKKIRNPNHANLKRRRKQYESIIQMNFSMLDYRQRKILSFG